MRSTRHTPALQGSPTRMRRGQRSCIGERATGRNRSSEGDDTMNLSRGTHQGAMLGVGAAASTGLIAGARRRLRATQMVRALRLPHPSSRCRSIRCSGWVRWSQRKRRSKATSWCSAAARAASPARRALRRRVPACSSWKRRPTLEVRAWWRRATATSPSTVAIRWNKGSRPTSPAFYKEWLEAVHCHCDHEVLSTYLRNCGRVVDWLMGTASAST